MPAHLNPEQLERALALRRKCFTHERIAAEIGVSRVTVSRALSAHDKRALKRLERRKYLTKVRQVEQLERIAEEAILAWERSQLDAETIKTTTSTGEDSEETPYEKTETTLKGQVGSSAFLAEARASLADVRKVLGLDKAVEVAEPDEPRPPRILIPGADARSTPRDEGRRPPEDGAGVGGPPA